jgi:DNA-binding SARP family transcriptional activator
MHAKRITFGLSSARRLKRSRHGLGLKAAFDYIVGEKLLNFASAASTHPEFARELPRFVSEVRRMFTPDEIAAHFAQIERAQAEKTLRSWTRMTLFVRVPQRERGRQFALIKELLIATTLGNHNCAAG